MKKEVYRRNLYNLIWYLSGWGGTDYSSTTRRDFLESVLEDLSKEGLLKGEEFEESKKELTKSFEEHPFYDQASTCFESMPTSQDRDYRECLITSWVK